MYREVKRLELPSLIIQEETVKDDIQFMLSQVKPLWQEFSLMPIPGGFSCLLYRCASLQDPDDVMAIRVIKRFGNSPLCNARLEIQVLNHLEVHGIFSPLLATFKNGYCYRFLSGQPLLDMNALPLCINDHILRLIANRMAQVHSMPLPKEVDSHIPFPVRLTELVKEKCPPSLPTGVPDHNALMDELRWLRGFLCYQGSDQVICHGDAHAGNIIWDKEKEVVYFVDWEWTHVGPRASDLAFFLHALSHTALTWGPNAVVLPPNHENKFVKYYLIASSKLKKGSVSKSDMESFKQAIKKHKLASMLTIAVVQTVFQEIPSFLSDNPNEFLARLYEGYFAYKKALLLES